MCRNWTIKAFDSKPLDTSFELIGQNVNAMIIVIQIGPQIKVGANPDGMPLSIQRMDIIWGFVQKRWNYILLWEAKQYNLCFIVRLHNP